jgi:hypothetical protein
MYGYTLNYSYKAAMGNFCQIPWDGCSLREVQWKVKETIEAINRKLLS